MQGTGSAASRGSVATATDEAAAQQGPTGYSADETASAAPREPVVPVLPRPLAARPSDEAMLPPQLIVAKRLLTGVVIVAMLLAAAYAVEGAGQVAVSTVALSSILLSRYFLPEQRLFLRRDDLAIDAVLLFIGWFAMLALTIAGARLLGLLEETQWHLFAIWGVATPVALLVTHAGLRWVAGRFYRPERHAPVVVVGVNPAARSLAEALDREPLSRHRLAGYFDDRSPERVGVAREHLLGSFDELPEYVKAQGVRCVYLTLPWNAQSRVHRLVDELKDSTASIRFVTDLSAYGLFEPRLFKLGRVRGISICDSPVEGTDALAKRVFDFVLSGIGILFLGPLMLVIAGLVKLTSPGPVIFKQTRYGLDGREIEVFKFRTLRVVEDDAVLRQVTKDDSRITPIGGVLRKTSLDELPQLFNVLQGTMSLVGPRPHAKVHNEVYRRLIKGYMIRHKVLPGITGLAQVNGYRGETETVDKMAARVAYDLHYIQNWSLWLDIEIIIRTFVTVWRRTNAY